uniref:hypothetical protein n=1 Tax=Enterobacter agglomerans TaxID=549 RepID=UPI001ABBCB62
MSQKVNRYVYREVPVLLRAGGELKKTRRIIIGYYNAQEDIVYPHPITDFIETEYYNYSLSLSHQRLPAIAVVQFLNYVSRMVEVNDSVFEG